MIELQNICWQTPEGKPILKNINVKIPNHRLIAISGPNGSGKTTLARILMGIETPTSGKILLDGEDITSLDVSQRAKKGMSFGFQHPICFKGITIQKMMNIAAGKELSETELYSLLHQVGLCGKDYLHRDLDATLSGGEIKRIEIATVLARNTNIMIFDEPEAGIDLWSFESLIGVFDAMRHQKHKTILVISHQERILKTADEIIMLVDGKIDAMGPSAEVLAKVKYSHCPIQGVCNQKEVL